MGKITRDLGTIGAEPLALIDGVTIRAEYFGCSTSDTTTGIVDINFRSIGMLEGLPPTFAVGSNRRRFRLSGLESSTFECFDGVGG